MRAQEDLTSFVGFDFVGQIPKSRIVDDLLPAVLVRF
jgi:hypothetical protein